MSPELIASLSDRELMKELERRVRSCYEEARRGHLREAWRLFQAMGADAALRRMKRDFGDLVG